MNTGGAYHLVGVGGIGMSALAQVLLCAGARVGGSDRARDRMPDRAVFARLAAAGVALHAQDGSGVTPGVDAVVVSTAIEPDNPDLAAAARLGIPVRHRAEILAGLADRRDCVAVTGTSGKSTVTALLGWILEQAGRDPTVVNGAVCRAWQGPDRVGNVRCGRSDWWVVEADESDRSLLHFHPRWAVITNASRDHFSAEETRALFAAFARQVHADVLDAGADPSWRQGFAPRAEAGGMLFDYRGIPFRVPMPGRHNAENALTAVVMGERLGIDTETMRAALAGFAGVQRRLERVGAARGVTVLDDYAHNPAKIRAAWEAAAPPDGRLLAVWRPHGYGPLRAMCAPLADAVRDVCRAGDRLWVLPVYDAGGTADRTIGAEALVNAVGRAAVRAADPDTAVREAAAAARAGDVVLVMGARDPDLPALARRLLAALTPPPPGLPAT
jgi:UDP-N-acetylmuramate--alanine ligase